jgi:hypothetical protein
MSLTRSRQAESMRVLTSVQRRARLPNLDWNGGSCVVDVIGKVCMAVQLALFRSSQLVCASPFGLIGFLAVRMSMTVIMEENQSQDIHGQPGATNTEDPFWVRDLWGVEEALDCFEDD